ncbi:MAG: hypothetical protein LBQ76_00200, partial [Candidatus Fibromonas sp.]|nr:hypothetical protein [Candidatus Fibromonas sp.]
LETGYISRTAGEFLKATSGWNYEGNGTDNYGFSALPGGRCYSDDGSFDVVGYYGYWWSASEHEYADEYEHCRDIAYGRRIDYDEKIIIWTRSSKSELFSVRCLRD